MKWRATIVRVLDDGHVAVRLESRSNESWLPILGLTSGSQEEIREFLSLLELGLRELNETLTIEGEKALCLSLDASHQLLKMSEKEDRSGYLSKMQAFESLRPRRKTESESTSET